MAVRQLSQSAHSNETVVVISLSEHKYPKTTWSCFYNLNQQYVCLALGLHPIITNPDCYEYDREKKHLST